MRYQGLPLVAPLHAPEASRVHIAVNIFALKCARAPRCQAYMWGFKQENV